MNWTIFFLPQTIFLTTHALFVLETFLHSYILTIEKYSDLLTIKEYSDQQQIHWTKQTQDV